MTTDELAAAPRACASGLYPLEAGVALLISSGAFLHRPDFTGRFIEHTTSGGTALAAIGGEAAVTALNGGAFPCSSGERRILQIAASLAADIPIPLGTTVTSLDNRNIGLLIRAILHASGQPEPHLPC